MRAQTLPSWQYEHLVYIDAEKQGRAKTSNALAAEARGEWIFQLDDDDLMLPGCLEQHLAHSEEADVVYTPPLVYGEDGHQFALEPPNIPCTSLIRRELWEKIGGLDESYKFTEDRIFYTTAFYHHKARFVRFEYPCWVYRFHGGNKSRGPQE